MLKIVFNLLKTAVILLKIIVFRSFLGEILAKNTI